MTHYRTGRDFEWTVRAALIEDGYEVIRSAGSKTKVDLVAFKQDQNLVVQCKRDGWIPPAERLALLRIAGLAGALPIVAYKRVGSTAVLYRRLLGPGAKEHEEWTTDVIA